MESTQPLPRIGRLLLPLLLLVTCPGTGRGDEPDGGYRLSGPAAGSGTLAGEPEPVSLPDLVAARGLALLLERDDDARRLARVVERWQRHYSQTLASHERLRQIEQQLGEVFSAMLSDPRRSRAGLLQAVESFPRRRRQQLVTRWLRSVFWRAGVVLPEDTSALEGEQRRQLCQRLTAAARPRHMESWRLRALLWLLRDRQVLRLSAERDRLRAELTPVDLSEESPDGRRLCRRYLDMVRQLRRTSDRHRGRDGRARTLRGLLRGLRYMDTIRRASAATGLDHRLVTRLLIQESAFIHQRVSWAGAYSLAQFLNIALKDIWMFRARIPGARQLLAGIDSYEQLRRLVIGDPRMAIRAACVYLRRLEDEVKMRLGERGRRLSTEMVTLLSLELYTLRSGLETMAVFDTLVETRRSWSAEGVPALPLPAPGGLLPDPASLLAGWMEQLLRRLVERKLSEQVLEQRLARLHQALGLAAYNAGMQNLIRAARRRGPLGPLAFPLELDETRNYIDDILDGSNLLGRVEELASPLADFDYHRLWQLAQRTCGDELELSVPVAPLLQK